MNSQKPTRMIWWVILFLSLVIFALAFILVFSLIAEPQTTASNSSLSFCSLALPPSDLYAHQDDTSITITWKSIQPPGYVDHFRVYRQTLSSSEWLLIGTTTETIYVDAAVRRGKSYTYRSTAISPCGVESAPSDSVSPQTVR